MCRSDLPAAILRVRSAVPRGDDPASTSTPKRRTAHALPPAPLPRLGGPRDRHRLAVREPSPLAPPGDLPSRQELEAPWPIDVSSTGADLRSGTENKDQESSIAILSLTGGDTVRIVDTTTQEELLGREREGCPLSGSASVATARGVEPPTVSEAAVIEIRGRPGKRKGEGRSFELPSDEQGKSRIARKPLEPHLAAC